jgi:nucleoside-diphosphate-sugar epimerase
MTAAPNSSFGPVLITGSSGLIGRSLLQRLAPRYRTVGLDVVEPESLPPNASFVPLDVSSDASVSRAIAEVRAKHGDHILSVVHLAAYYDFSGRPSEKYEVITIRGTERLLNAVKDLTVEQVIFSSTALVHAPCRPGERINEDWPVQPKWDYPKSKVETERLLLAQSGGIPVVLLRIAGVYDDYGHSLPISQQIQRIYEKRLTSRVFPGDSSRGQPLVHMDDLLDAFELCIERRGSLPNKTTLLIGEPETMSYGELQSTLGELIHGRRWETLRIPKPLAKAGAWLQDKIPIGGEPFIKPWMIDIADDHAELDVSRAKELLGWEPKHRVRNSLRPMVSALKSDPLGWYRAHKLRAPRPLTRRVRRQPRLKPT